MNKNVLIVTLVIALIGVIFWYEVLSDKISVTKETDVIVDTGVGEAQMRLYGKENSFTVRSDDGKFRIPFFYDANGLGTFGVNDSISNISLGFTFSNERVLQTFFYGDDIYAMATNLGCQYSRFIVQRLERFCGIYAHYEHLEYTPYGELCKDNKMV